MTDERDRATSDDGERASAARADVVRRLVEVARPVVEAAGFELDDLEYRPQGRNALVQVFLDAPGGVTVDDCANVSRQLDVAFDTADPIAHAWTLEVSSPGLTRPLKRRAHWERAVGRLVVATTRGAFEGRSKLVGRLVALEGDSVVLDETGSEERLHVPLDRIAKARLEIEPAEDVGRPGDARSRSAGRAKAARERARGPETKGHGATRGEVRT